LAHHEFDVRLRIGRDSIRLALRIPDTPITLVEFLPIVHAISDLSVQAAQREVENGGRVVSCGPSCGACCRQLVPIGPSEALAIRRLVSRLDARHGRRVLDRFARARQHLEDADMRRRIDEMSPDAQQSESRRTVGLAYFSLGIACPFLEQESCSIHAERPLACREYLVVTPPRHCSNPEAGRVQTVEMPRRLSMLYQRFVERRLGERAPGIPRWLPLTAALDESLFDPAALTELQTPGPELFECFLSALAADTEDGTKRTADGQ